MLDTLSEVLHAQPQSISLVRVQSFHGGPINTFFYAAHRLSASILNVDI